MEAPAASPSSASRTPPTSPDAYADYFWSAKLRPEMLDHIDAGVSAIVAAKPRLEKVASVVNTPWYFVGVYWFVEMGNDFSRHLHNGDPLTARTINIPAGRPEIWPPPNGEDPWEYSAADAIRLEGLANVDVGKLGELLARFERLNGLGYRQHGLFTPYLWSGTDLYERGKYVSDGHFDPEAVSEEIGVVALLRRLHETNLTNLRSVPTVNSVASN